jgi:arabinose-5-phosphate isomerase
VVDLIVDCPSKVIATGIGKAGHNAHQFFATLSSKKKQVEFKGID